MNTDNLIFIHIHIYVGIYTYICGKKEKLIVLVGLSETKECKTGLYRGGIHGSSEGIRNGEGV
jgi:hypothetical protein